VNDPLQTTLSDLADFLNREGITYALVGGIAASLRGQPRATADVDMVIGVDIPRALALAIRLEGTNFRPLFDNVSEIVERSFILPLRHRSTNIRVDLALALSGFEQGAIDRADSLNVSGSIVSVITAEDLVIMKVLAGRPQDEQDLRGIVTAQIDCLDWDYCLRTARELGEALGQDLVGPIRALRDEARP
jgi:hypothetical protein